MIFAMLLFANFLCFSIIASWKKLRSPVYSSPLSSNSRWLLEYFCWHTHSVASQTVSLLSSCVFPISHIHSSSRSSYRAWHSGGSYLPVLDSISYAMTLRYTRKSVWWCDRASSGSSDISDSYTSQQDSCFEARSLDWSYFIRIYFRHYSLSLSVSSDILSIVYSTRSDT